MHELGEPLFVARPHVRVAFHRRGDWLIGVVHLQGPGAPVVLTARANVADLERAARALILYRGRHAASVGLFGGLGKALKKATRGVESIAKGKVARTLYGQVRKVMKSPIASAALAATSLAFPPIGIPASAAFVTANKVLDNVEAGGAAANKAKAQIRALTRMTKMPGAAGEKARKVAKIISLTNKWRKGLKAPPVMMPGVASHRDPSDVRGELILPGGKRARLQGVERGGQIEATIILPNGRSVPLRASVQGACGC